MHFDCEGPGSLFITTTGFAGYLIKPAWRLHKNFSRATKAHLVSPASAIVLDNSTWI
jgi:hypothetical protein